MLGYLASYVSCRIGHYWLHRIVRPTIMTLTIRNNWGGLFFSQRTTKGPRETFRCLIPFSLLSLPSSASVAVARLISFAAGDTNATIDETREAEGGRGGGCCSNRWSNRQIHESAVDTQKISMAAEKTAEIFERDLLNCRM